MDEYESTGCETADIPSWVDHEFAPTEVRQWLDVGVGAPHIADWFRSAGLSPADVYLAGARLTSSGPVPGGHHCVLDAVSAGDVDPQVVFDEWYYQCQ